MERESRRFDGSAWYLREMDRRTRAALKRQEDQAEAAIAGEDDVVLLARVRERAEALGHAPQMNEVPGARAIAERIGGWPGVLRRLGYTAPEGTPKLSRSHRYREEYARQQELYRERKREKEDRRMKRRKHSPPRDEE